MPAMRAAGRSRARVRPRRRRAPVAARAWRRLLNAAARLTTCARVPGSPTGSGRTVRAVDGVSLELARERDARRGRRVRLGQDDAGAVSSGSRTPTSGRIEFDGQPVDWSKRRSARALRRDIQMIFQDTLRLARPALDGARADRRAAAQLRRPRRGRGASAAIDEVLSEVGSPTPGLARRPPQLSGGQRQRVGIARAVVARPRAGGLRRAGVGARRLDPRPDPRAARAPARAPRA